MENVSHCDVYGTFRIGRCEAATMVTCKSPRCGMRHHRSVLLTLSSVWVVHPLGPTWKAEVQTSSLCSTAGPQAHAAVRCSEWTTAKAVTGVGTHILMM